VKVVAAEKETILGYGGDGYRQEKLGMEISRACGFVCAASFFSALTNLSKKKVYQSFKTDP
jgi:hypothetical protein